MVLVAAAGNHDFEGLDYPASDPLVIAVGASNQNDRRACPPADECGGSQYGPGLSVVAPGIQCWVANMTGNGGGFNDNGGQARQRSCKDYPAPTGDAAGKYYGLFNGTSAATPHVAGLAALIRSAYPAMSNDLVRRAIEESADKVPGYDYAQTNACRPEAGTRRWATAASTWRRPCSTPAISSERTGGQREDRSLSTNRCRAAVFTQSSYDLTRTPMGLVRGPPPVEPTTKKDTLPGFLSIPSPLRTLSSRGRQETGAVRQGRMKDLSGGPRGADSRKRATLGAPEKHPSGRGGSSGRSSLRRHHGGILRSRSGLRGGV